MKNLATSKKSSQPIQIGLVSSHISNAAPSISELEDARNDDQDDMSSRQAALQILNKEDAKAHMKTKEFDIFINKTSKIIERALTGNVDVLGSSWFFDEGHAEGEDEDGIKASDKVVQQRERLVPLFTFQDNEPNQRTVTSIEWSPQVSCYAI